MLRGGDGVVASAGADGADLAAGRGQAVALPSAGGVALFAFAAALLLALYLLCGSRSSGRSHQQSRSPSSNNGSPHRPLGDGLRRVRERQQALFEAARDIATLRRQDEELRRAMALEEGAVGCGT